MYEKHKKNHRATIIHIAESEEKKIKKMFMFQAKREIINFIFFLLSVSTHLAAPVSGL